MTDSEVSMRIVRRVRALIDQEFPGSTMNFDPLGLGYISGFGIKHNGGLTLVWVDRTAEPWWLMVDGCVTAGIQDEHLPLEWVNKKNRNVLFGKFYCNIDRTQNIAAIFYEFNFLGPLLEAIFEDTALHGSASLV